MLVGRPSSLDAELHGNRSLFSAALCKDSPLCGQVFMCDLILVLCHHAHPVLIFLWFLFESKQTNKKINK